MAAALRRLEIIELLDTELTTKQLETVFTAIKEHSEHNVKKLDVRHNDLSGVAPDILAGAVIKVEEVLITGTNLTTNTLPTLLYLLSTSSEVRLRRLDLRQTNLSLVQLDILAAAVSGYTQIAALCRVISFRPGELVPPRAPSRDSQRSETVERERHQRNRMIKHFNLIS